jgi:hypothetical protein
VTFRQIAIRSTLPRSARRFTSQTVAIFLALGSFNAAADQPATGVVAGGEVWISAQAHNGGTGTSSNPYDGSTQIKFDAVIAGFQNTPNVTIHLGAGTFRSDVSPSTRWQVQPGWIIDGAGMYLTTCQMMGNLTGKHWDQEFFKSSFNGSTDNVAIRDLTVDCNWSELSLTADFGAGGEQWGAIHAISLMGSNNLIERVRQINSHGSWANSCEPFGIQLSAPATGDATGNIIRYCRAELPQGNYGAAFALQGWVSGSMTHFMTNSSVYGNYVAGQNTGTAIGFTTGGVNAAFIKNCQIHDNTFTDCQSIYYQDTGSIDGLQILNNKLVRGWLGIGLVASADPTWTKNNVTIAGNSLNIQNRTAPYGSAGYGIQTSGSTSSNVSITGNYISFTPTGQGYKQFLTISAGTLVNSTISNNTADEASAGLALAGPLRAQTSGSNIQISANRTVAGLTMTGLADSVAPSQTPGKTLNFSTRATVGTGENTLIDGFIITGTAPKKVIMRALGPSLTQYGVQSALTNPTLTLYDQTGAILTSNDNWKDTQQTEIAATGLQPSNDLESAIVQTLPPGMYTAGMNGKNGATGVGLIEVYDLDSTADSTLGNVSTRGLVGTGDNVVIGGLIVGSGTNPEVLAMGIGPSLANVGIHNPLADPFLQLYDGNGGLIAENNDWQDTQPELIAATGLAPTDSHEAAIMVWPAPGNYTAILRGNNGTSGVGLLEVFRMN